LLPMLVVTLLIGDFCSKKLLETVYQ